MIFQSPRLAREVIELDGGSHVNRELLYSHKHHYNNSRYGKHTYRSIAYSGISSGFSVLLFSFSTSYGKCVKSPERKRVD